MGAPTRPDVAPGPHRELADALGALHHRAGRPSLRTLARETGVSHTTVSKVLSCTSLPSWGAVELLVEAMDGDVERFRDLWLAATTPQTISAPAPQIAGRRAELTVVRRHLQARSGLLLVTGEAGIGKTTLVDAARASTQTFVAVGHCLNLSREMPLLPMVDALRAVAEQDDGRWLDEALARCPVYVRASLARLLPELDDAAGPPAPDDPWGLERLFAAVTSTLRALAVIRPFAVLVEDGHWADAGTLDLLSHLSTGATPPILVTWRSGDPDVPAGHTEWLARTRSNPAAVSLDLAPLTMAQTAQQLALLAGSAPGEDVVERVHKRSRGLPLYTAQLAAEPEDSALPGHLADLLDHRIGRLDDASWRVVRVLGVAQRGVPSRVLRAATGLGSDELDHALHALARRGLLRPATGDVAELGHPLFVEAIERRLVPGEGAQVHARLAGAMSDAPGVGPEEIADHWAAAGQHDREVAHRVAAAHRARSRFAFRRELDNWIRVLTLWDEGHSAPGTERWEVLVRALDAAVAAGEVAAGHDLAERTRLLDLDELPLSARAQVLHRLGAQRLEEGDGTHAVELLDEAMQLLDRDPPSPELLHLVEERVGILILLGRHAEAGEAIDRLFTLLDGDADPRTVRRAQAWLIGHTMHTTGDPEAALALARRALDTALPEPDPIADLMVAANATDVLLHTREPAERAEEIARRALAAADEWDLGLSYVAVLVRTNVTSLHLYRGSTSTARSWIEPVTCGLPTTNTAPAHLCLAAVELREGHVTDAVRRCREATTQVRSRDEGWLEGVLWMAEAELWADHLDAAESLLAEALGHALRSETSDWAAPLLALAARSRGDVVLRDRATPDERRSAARDLRRLRGLASADPFGATVHDVAVDAWTLLWEAELARMEGRASVEGWVRAASAWDDLGRPHDSAYCRWRAAQVAVREGRATVAARLARRAAADSREHVPLAEAIAATLGQH